MHHFMSSSTTITGVPFGLTSPNFKQAARQAFCNDTLLIKQVVTIRSRNSIPHTQNHPPHMQRMCERKSQEHSPRIACRANDAIVWSQSCSVFSEWENLYINAYLKRGKFEVQIVHVEYSFAAKRDTREWCNVEWRSRYVAQVVNWVSLHQIDVIWLRFWWHSNELVKFF